MRGRLQRLWEGGWIVMVGVSEPAKFEDACVSLLPAVHVTLVLSIPQNRLKRIQDINCVYCNKLAIHNKNVHFNIYVCVMLGICKRK